MGVSVTLVNNLGAIAKSDAAMFTKAFPSHIDISMIGQLSVELYSAYIIAEHVWAVAKHNGDKQHNWESTAGGTFTITPNTSSFPLSHSSEMCPYLKDKNLGPNKTKPLRTRDGNEVDNDNDDKVGDGNDGDDNKVGDNESKKMKDRKLRPKTRSSTRPSFCGLVMTTTLIATPTPTLMPTMMTSPRRRQRQR